MVAVGLALLARSGGDASEIDPARVPTVVDNPYVPLPEGRRWVDEGRTDGGLERVVVEVRRAVAGGTEPIQLVRMTG